MNLFIYFLNPEIIIGISTIFLSIFYLLLNKAPKNTMIIYFWLHVLSYIGFSFLFFFKEKFIHFDTTALKQLIFDTSYYNMPLYLLSGACVVGTYAIFDLLMKSYSISLILALSQISLILTTVGYILLGDKITIISSIGIIIIFIGSILSGCKSFSLANPLESFKEIDKKLFVWSIIKAILFSATILITYVCISFYNETTKAILHTLTKHLRFIPCMPIAPIHFNIGAQFATFILMFLFIIYHLKASKTIIPTLKNNYRLIFALAFLYVLETYFYYEAYDLIENKNLITAISQLYLPLTFIGSVVLYKEKSSSAEWIGMGIIIIGTIITVFG